MKTLKFEFLYTNLENKLSEITDVSANNVYISPYYVKIYGRLIRILWSNFNHLIFMTQFAKF